MALRTVLFLGLLVASSVGALFDPILGALGYMGHYCIGPERQWWGAPIRHWGLRCSFTLAVVTAVGMVLNWRQLKYGKSLLRGHEKLVLIFLALVWLARVLSPETVGRYTQAGIDHPSVKFTKVIIFALMMTHVATSIRNIRRLLWVLVVGALFLGLQAWSTPRRSFIAGRLEGIGGPDFTEANFFAAFMATALILIGVQFLRSDWRGKLICLVSGAFTANAIVLTRSRGAVVGLAAGGLAAAFMAPKEHRLKTALGLVVAFAGFLYVADPQFLDRASTITRSEEDRDSSAQSRIRLAQAGLKMVRDHPLGVGVGNFYQSIGHYIPEYAGKDAHNTFVRCLTETGILGFAVFIAMIISGFRTLRRLARDAMSLPPPQQREMRLLAFGLTISLTTLLACCLTISLTYVEFLWWYLMLPVCLQRALENARVELPSLPAENTPQRARTGLVGGQRKAARSSAKPSRLGMAPHLSMRKSDPESHA